MNTLQMIGKKYVAGYEFTGIEGGFGEGKKAMLVKEIAEIHEQQIGEVNRRINDNRNRFKDAVDIIDIRANGFEPLGRLFGYTKQSFNQSKNIYLLSERGYAKLLKILEDDTAWELYDKLVEEYFNLRANKKQAKVSTEETDQAKEMNARARLLNAQTRQANMLLKTADTFKDSLSADAKHSLVAHATRILTGEMLLSLPEVRKTYSASEIGKELGVSANQIGRLANKHNLKTDEYGMEALDKARHSHKQVPSFRYFDNAKPVFRELLS
ncbi:ORF6N domain-containing protein [Bacillus cereus]|uniref:ORF6N domain-containing protein n=1 Tax=Bacillus cereus TaxID=1396 RepID=UPI00211EC766|nr:ORF6N domain-containing protein [Bacillus cereus]